MAAKTTPGATAPAADVALASKLLAPRPAKDPRYITAGKGATIEDGVSVFRGATTSGSVASLVVKDGTRETGLRLDAVAVAIRDGLITDAEIAALVAARA